MSWQLPGGYFGSSSAEDEWMMQEILQLLASEDPNSNRMETVSTPESSQPSLGTTTTTNNNSSSSGIDSAGDNSNSITDLMRSRGIAGGNVRASGANVRYEDCNEDEEKQPAERRPAQQGSMQRQEMSKEGRDTAQQVPYPSSLMSLANAAAMEETNPAHATSRHGVSQSCHEPRCSSAVASSAISPGPIVAPRRRRTSTTPSSAAPKPAPPPAVLQTSSAQSNILPTGQHVHVMNDPEFEDFRRRIQMQTASRRYRKRKKEEKRQQNLQIQGLQAELVRLQELETEYRQYQQRSVESLEEELAARTDEVNDLTAQVADAVKEELYWIEAMKKHLPRK